VILKDLKKKKIW